MTILAITDPGTRVGLKGEELILHRGGAEGLRVRIQQVTEVIAFGPIEFGAAAIAALLATGLEIMLLTSAGRFRGRIIGRGSRNAAVRLEQYRRSLDPAFRLAFARSIARGKIANQRALLLQAQREIADDQVADALARMRLLADGLGSVTTLDELRGKEGAAASAYFGVFGKTIRNPVFSFDGRTRRPPRDPVNACLSFGYSVLGSVIESAVLAAGLDPLLGFLHEVEYGRPSLMLDLLEEFRAPMVDAVTIRLINRRQLGAGDFRRPDREDLAEEILEGGEIGGSGNAEGAVLLGPVGRRVFLAALFARLREEVYFPPCEGRFSYRAILTEQVRHLSRVIQGVQPEYKPFRVK